MRICKMNLKKIQFQFLMLIIIRCVNGNLNLNDENVCLKTETYETTIQTVVSEPITIHKKVWCWDARRNFRCDSEKTEWITVTKPKVVNRTKLVPACCSGYSLQKKEHMFRGKTYTNTVCEPVCHSGCYNGKCTKPGYCDCKVGFFGSKCDKVCPPNLWGNNCKKNCLCFNDGKCDPVSGNCDCAPGWQGASCQQPCSDGYYGKSCNELCNCNREKCDSVTGECFTTTEIITTTINSAKDSFETYSTTTTRNFQQQTDVNSRETSTVTQSNIVETNHPEKNILKTATAIKSTESTVTPEETTITMVIFEKETNGTTPPEETTNSMAVFKEVTTSTTETDKTTTTKEVFTSTTPPEETTTRMTAPEEETVSTTEHKKKTTTKTAPEESTGSILPTKITDTTAYTTEKLSDVNTTEEKTNSTVDFINRFYGTTETTTKLPDKVIHETKINQVIRNEIEIVERTQSESKPVLSSSEYGEKIVNLNELLEETENTEVTGKESTKNIWGDETELDGVGSDSKSNSNTPNKYSKMTHFIPSLTVVSGVSILLFLLAVRWLLTKRRKNIAKIESEKQNKLCYLQERRISLLDGKFLVNNFSENPVCLSEEEINAETPVLITFKPVDSNRGSTAANDSIKMKIFETE